MAAPHLDVDPWLVREARIDTDTLAVAESLFTVSNGFIGIRGTLDEVDPCVTRGTFMSGVFESHPLSYPEGSYGHPEEGQAMISVTDGTPLRLLVDGTALDITKLEPEVHERTLDLRAGTLERRLRFTSLAGTTIEVRSTRLVSLAEPSVAVIRYEVTALDGPAHLVIRSELAGHIPGPAVDNDDPRVAEALEDPFEHLTHNITQTGGLLVTRTRRTGIGVGAAVRHDVDGGRVLDVEADEDRVVTTLAADLTAGGRLVVIKTLGYAWARGAEYDTLGARAEAAIRSATELGWDGLLVAQRQVLDEWWASADVDIDGDPELQQAVRFNLFQLFGAAACIQGAPIGAKGLTGTGYSGHTFWDIEGFVVPVLILLRPGAAARLLRWRAGTLDLARERAEEVGLEGASFPWRTIDGREVSAYWPASTAAMHVNADISRAFWLYGNVTKRALEGVRVLEVLVETARLWASLGHLDHDGGWHLFGVTGPDEYTGVVDDNVFTNVMAKRNLIRAAEMCELDPDAAKKLDVDEKEVRTWRDLAAAVHVPWDPVREVHPANTNFTTYREWSFDNGLSSFPVQDHEHYAKFYRRQVLKQADLVQALWWCHEDFTDEEVARDLEYYEARTVRDSSLSAAVQAVVCAQAQHPDLAHRYLREAALADLRDAQDNANAGLHLASVGGTWLAVAAGLGGMREDGDELVLAPLLPAKLSRVAFHLTWHGRLLRVETTREGTVVTLVRGDGPVDVVLDGERLSVSDGRPARAPLRTPTPLRPEPKQAPGFEPTT